MFPKRTRLALGLVMLAEFALILGLSWARYANLHQRTFDLALYARIAWGLARGDGWSPVLGTSALGCHLSPILLVLGLLGRLFGTVPVLLVAQAAAIALSAYPLARIGARRLGTRGVWLAVAAWLLYPNLIHVGTYEFHPGTLAVLPMVWAFDALDRGNLRQLVGCAIGALCCREEMGAFAAIMLLLYYLDRRELRAIYAGLGVVAYSIGSLLIVSAYAPKQGSADAHFGIWGGTPFGIVAVFFREPGVVLAHLRPRLSYLPRLLAPLSFFSLRAPRLLLPALPYIALNLISAFPTSDKQYSHYLTPAVPALVVSGLVGVTEVRARFPRITWFIALAIAHFALGGSPLSYDFDRSAYVADASTEAAREVLARIPAEASVQAPDALLPHLVERHDLRRAPPPDQGTQYMVVDVSHRQRYARQETLLRTSEEPLIRSWSSWNDRRLLVYAPPYALFVREPGKSAGCYGTAAGNALPLTSCLAAQSYRVEGDFIAITLSASAPCQPDLALRFGPDPRPARVELLCDGALSPAKLRAGDVLVSRYRLQPAENALIEQRGLWVGALRANGDPIHAEDPVAIPLRRP